MAEPFLDDESARVLDWTAIWREFQPITPYGRAKKAHLQPFLPGEEVAWAAAQAQQTADIAALDDGLIEQVSSLLQALPDVCDALDTLSNAGGALSAKHCLALKGFARGGRQLVQRLQGVIADGLRASMFGSLLAPFGQPDTPSFSVAHVAGAAYVQAGQQYAAAVHRRTEAGRRRNEALQQETGAMPNRDGQLVFALPQHRDLIEQLKAEQLDLSNHVASRLIWLRDTPFEAVFAAVETKDMRDAQARADAAEIEMQAAADEAMRHLSDGLRAALPEWQRAVEKVTAIDLRIAKVALARRWQGSVATTASWPQLTAAVHPLLAATYAASGRRYVPQDWHLDRGVNVLSGSNMGGKTLAMQLLCICQCLAQYGLPVPASGFATRLYSAVRVCASADTEAASGLSSFGKEMTRLVQTWPLLGGEEPVLICFDEPGRSTNPVEGEALVIGLLQAALEVQEQGQAQEKGQVLGRGQSVVIVATHFAGAAKVQKVAQYRVRGLGAATLSAVAGRSAEERMRDLSAAMDYRVEPVAAGTFAVEGMRVASWLGVPDAVLDKAEEFLAGQTLDERGSRR